MMEVPTTFLRWAARERADMLAKFPGLPEYVETRIGATGCVASQTRVARPAPESAQGRGKPAAGVKLPPREESRPAAGVARSEGDLFALAQAMRREIE
jgi:hypothetical protein